MHNPSVSGAANLPANVSQSSSNPTAQGGPPLSHGHGGAVRYHPVTTGATHPLMAQLHNPAATSGPQVRFSQPNVAGPAPASTLQIRLADDSTQKLDMPPHIHPTLGNSWGMRGRAQQDAFRKELQQVSGITPTKQTSVSGNGRTLERLEYQLPADPLQGRPAPTHVQLLHSNGRLHGAAIFTAGPGGRTLSRVAEFKDSGNRLVPQPPSTVAGVSHGVQSTTAALGSRVLARPGSSMPPARTNTGHDGFMHQDDYRRLLPQEDQQAVVDSVIAMSDALGFLVPWDDAQIGVSNPLAGMTMDEMLQKKLPYYGVQKTEQLKLPLGQGATVQQALQGFFARPGINSGVIELQTIRPGSSGAVPHRQFISMVRQADGNWRISDSSTGVRVIVPNGATGIAAHLAQLYQSGPVVLSIRAFDRGQITRVHVHRMAATTFRNAVTAGTSTTATTTARTTARTTATTKTKATTTATTAATTSTSAAGTVAPARLSNSFIRRTGLDQLERVRDNAFQQFIAAQPVLATVSPANLALGGIELIARRDFSQGEELRWQQAYPNETPAQRGGKYYRIGSDRIIDAMQTESLFHSWKALCVELDQSNLAANFFASLGGQPVPTPEPISNGTGFFRLDLAKWNSVMPPNMLVEHAFHAYLLSNMVGEWVAPSHFASMAQIEADPRARMRRVAEELFGPQPSPVSFGPQQHGTLMTFLNAVRETMVYVEYARIGANGQPVTTRQLLRRDGQNCWLHLTSNRWTPLSGNQGLSAYVDTTLWREQGRDATRPMYVLPLRNGSDTTAQGVRARMRAAYYTITGEPQQGSSSQVQPTRTAAQDASALCIVRNEKGFETNDSILRRVEAALLKLNYPRDHFYIRLPQRMATTLSNPQGPTQTFAELHQDGQLRARYDAFLRTIRPGEFKNGTHARSKTIDPLVHILKTDMLPTTIPSKLKPSNFSNHIESVFRRVGRSTNDMRDVVRRLEKYLTATTGRPVDLKSFTPQQFDAAVRAYLDKKYVNALGHPVRGTPRLTSRPEFMRAAQTFGAVYEAHTTGTITLTQNNTSSYVRRYYV